MADTIPEQPLNLLSVAAAAETVRQAVAGLAAALGATGIPAAYIGLGDGGHTRVVEVDPGTLVDVDEQGRPVGVEIIGTSIE